MDAKFEELSHDTNIIAKLKQFGEAAFKIQDMVELVNDPSLFDKLSNTDKIKYNLLLSYSLNTLFWMYLRAEGMQKLSFLKYKLIIAIYVCIYDEYVMMNRDRSIEAPNQIRK